jgi:hypothetical protein
VAVAPVQVADGRPEVTKAEPSAPAKAKRATKAQAASKPEAKAAAPKATPAAAPKPDPVRPRARRAPAKPSQPFKVE